MHPGLESEADLATLVARSMKEKDTGSVELLLVLDGILQVCCYTLILLTVHVTTPGQ